ncbi:hypothetical protein KZO01_21480 [Kurthia zopfii]|uniref:Inner membrane protein yeeR n=1 Tax=Kurthia zopfii TaxID=1650 RepID=A0A8B4QCN8_9BACL|nr:hypothetical protein [Kurthia zopfii]PWI21361.1 hypothetical protein DF281_12675 [Kurthia zopfii]TDR34361.1 hypothetical protein DFR61_14016 [Kurthia zopfii]GEK31839.1 hypothetical protein KZO01_21480 [Kurthia zopfii]STX10553.1 Inner membrane protein yeeR [Kurthia zopfii]
MNKLPICSLDLETRLQLDKLTYESEEYVKETLEGFAFKYFYEEIMQELENTKDKLNDEKHSLELLMLDRDINAIMKILKKYESKLQTEQDEDLLILYSFIYEIGLRYRYTLGLYETDETFSSYRNRKIEDLDGIYEVNDKDFKLTTLAISHNEVIDDSRTNYVDILLQTANSYCDEGDRFKSAYYEIKSQLRHFELPTKYDWSLNVYGWRFGYLEQRAIQAEIIMHLKNKLRDALLIDFKWEIQKYITALNIVYYVNLKVSNVHIEQNPVNLPEMDYIDASYISTGILGASMYNASTVYADNVRMLGTRGHGIAAERANDLIDKVLGKEAILLGDDNAKNGADRLVNGQAVQTKYCATGGKSISECFDQGKFRYVENGRPMQIEVPKDQYEQAVQSMRDRIQRGELSDLGITNPKQAEQIVRKGNVSYKTAQRVAKAGTIEGVTYDAAKGMVTGLQTFGVSATFSFATAIWRGENADEALEHALKDGTAIFGRHVMQHVLTQQVGRTAIEKSLRPATDYVVKNILGSKTSAQIVNTFFRSTSQGSIHGVAALNNLSKLMRGNIVTMAITTAVLSAGSIYDIINGRISGSQLFKNIGTTGASVGGAAIGATMGSVVPVVGTIIGGFVGGFIGGKVSKMALDVVIDDDSLGTMEDLKRIFVENIEELQLDRDELNYIVRKIFDEKSLPKELKLIYSANNSEEYISRKMDRYINVILKVRPKIKDFSNFVENYQHSVEV